LTQNETSEISEGQVAELLGLVRKTAFWSSPTEVISDGEDGARWILEGVDNGHYHVVDRWSPKHSDYEQLCLYLLEQSRIKVEVKETY